METGLGTTVPVFLGLTVVLFGGAAFLTGQALAQTWRPWWQAVPSAILLGLGDLFLAFTLFGGEPSVVGYLVHTLVLLAIMLLAWRITQVHRMVTQYPWIYERAGLFAWRERRG
ncbi:MAG: hypothetical protein IT561_07660 [Alphaproteobacteria bacterium]|nr:hypothetical protein [Alphaproteobacteria bacterium]